MTDTEEVVEVVVQTPLEPNPSAPTLADEEVVVTTTETPISSAASTPVTALAAPSSPPTTPAAPSTPPIAPAAPAPSEASAPTAATAAPLAATETTITPEIRLEEISFLRDDNNKYLNLGSGATGTVYLAKYQRMPVAVKIIDLSKYELSEEEIKTLEHEVLVSEPDALNEFPHPNIVKVLGRNIPNKMIVLEYLERGSLLTNVKKKLVTLETRGIEIMQGIAKGLHWLHHNKPIYVDLKSTSILLSEDWTPKIADFGLSGRLQGINTKDPQNRSKHIVNWASPEALKMKYGPNKDLSLSEASDVFSMGMIMLEIVTGQIPWSDLSDEEIVSRVLEGQRPSIPETCPAELKQLIQRTWHETPAERITSHELEECLLKIEPPPAKSVATAHTNSSFYQKLKNKFFT